MYFGLRGEKLGHVIGNNILTVDGKLYWAVEYFPHVTTKTQAEDFIGLVLANFERSLCAVIKERDEFRFVIHIQTIHCMNQLA